MRPTKHSYPEAGSRARIMEAVFAMWECETSEASDSDFDRAEHRFWQAVKARERAIVVRLTGWQRKGGKARWAHVPKQQRIEHARMMARARIEKEARQQADRAQMRENSARV